MSETTAPTRMPLAKLGRTARGKLALLVLSLLGAALALRASSIQFDLELAEGRLLLKAYDVTVDFGLISEDQNLTFYNIGQGEKRSPVFLFRESGFLSDVWRLLAGYSKPPEPIVVSGSELQQGPVSMRFWNPSYPGLAVHLGSGTALGSVRFRIPDKSLEIHTGTKESSVPWSAPLLMLLIAGLAFALLSGCALFCFISLLWSLTARVAPGASQATAPSAPLPHSAGRTSRVLRVLNNYQWCVVFVLGTVWIGYVRFMVFQNQYGFGDEMNYLIQARILASGHVSLLQPTDADFFKVGWMDLMVGDGKIWNFHPIGNSILLAIGVLLGSPAIVPPLVGGGIFAALFALARRLVGSAAFAWLSVLVAASSQYVATVTASFMAHAPALLFIELATLALVIFWQTGGERYVILTGAFLGTAFIMRPLSAVLIGVVPAVLLCVALLQRKVRLRTLVLAAVVALGIASLECWRTYLTAGQFTLAYMAKGPEASMTFPTRWARGWDYRLKNLFVNYRYYHSRIFGLGFAGNLMFFFIPLVVAWRLWWVRLAYVAIVIYWVVHSFLHFYGWMWEPRMLFEFTHLTVLLSAYGMWLLITYRGAGPGRINPLAAVAAVAVAGAFLGFNFFYDLPERFRTEYYHYNKTDPYVRDQIREQGIRNAIFFYKDATAGYALHSGDNAIAVGKNGEAVFEGDVIHAIHRGNVTDYALISRYPDRRLFFVQGPQLMQEQPNFYRDALPKLAATLSKYQDTHDVAVGVPWLDLADSKALSAYNGIKFFDDQGFFSTFVDGTLPNRPFVIALVGDMKNYTAALREVYATVEPIAADDLGYPVSIVEVDPASKRAINGSLGLQMNVHRVAKEFKAAPFTPTQCLSVPAVSQRVGLVHFDANSQVFVCVEWSGEFYLDAPATYTFALVSDDGAGIVIDGKTVVDKGMFKSNDGPRQEGTVHLDPGRHTFYLTYVQILGAALLEVEVKKDSEPFAPLNMASLGGVMRVRTPDEVANRFSLMGLGSVVTGTSTAVDDIDDVTAGEPIVEVLDPGPDEGSLHLRFPKPYSAKDYPYVQFYYKMTPDTAYSMMVRLAGESEFIELPMRIEQPRREGKTVGAFNAQQDNQWHLMKFDLYEALGSRDVRIEEAIMGEWAGAAERRTLHFKDFCVGPYKAQIIVRGPDNQVRLIPSPVSVASADGPTLDARNAAGPCPLPVSAPAAAPPPATPAASVVAAAEDAQPTQASAPAKVEAPESAPPTAAGAGAKPAETKSGRTVKKAPVQMPSTARRRRGTGPSPAPAAQLEATPTPSAAPQLIDNSVLRVSSSRQDAPELASRAIDGSVDTRWDTGGPQGGGEWFRIDLTRPVQLASMVLDTGTFAQDYPRHLDVLVSADGNTFRQVAALDGHGSLNTVDLEKPVQACSVRLEQKGKDGFYYWSINELQLRGVPLPGECAAASRPTAAPTKPPTPTAAPAAAAPDMPPVNASELRVSSSRTDAPELAAYAVDEFAFSRWDTGRPQTGREWFRVDLPGIGELSRIRLLVEAAPMDYPRLLQVSTSTDGTHFEPVVTMAGSAPNTDVVFNPPVRCSAVRLEQKGSDPRFFWAINTLTLWGQFPKLQRSWWQRIPNPAAWLALSAVLLTGWGTFAARRRAAARPTQAAAVRTDASPTAGRWRIAGILTAVVFGVILIGTQNDYGETWDEWEHFSNGEQYYQYLFGNGKTPDLYGHVFRKYYGPFSDIVATVIKHLVFNQLGLLSENSAIHLHLNLLFVAGGLILFFVILPESGGRAAYLCLLAYFASPHLLGHCHNNMKDFAVTGWIVAAVFAFYAGLRRRSYPGMALAGLVTGMSLATKINGAVVVPVLLAFVVLFIVVDTHPEESAASRIRFAVLGCGVVYGTMTLAGTIVFWPWLWAAPYARFWETVRFFQHHIWNGLVLYKGRMIQAAQIPREYAPYYVLITTPIPWLPFAAAGLVRASIELTRRRLLFALVGLAFLTPIAVEVFTSVPIYDGVRHFLPAFPFLACLVGFGMDWLLTVAQRTRLSRGVAWLVVGVAIGSAIVQNIRIHPYQSTYFNTLAGGGRGAMGQFELDYWGNSLKEAGRWVNEHAAPKSRVDVILGLHRLAGLRQDLLGTDSDPDYAIVLNRESLAPDPYKARTPIYSVTADGAVLTRVYRLTPP